MQLFDNNRFLFALTLGLAIGIPTATPAQTFIAPDEIAGQTTPLPEENDVASSHLDSTKTTQKKRRAARKNRAKGTILLEKASFQQEEWLLKEGPSLRYFQEMGNAVTINPGNNLLIILMEEEVIVINPGEPFLETPPSLPEEIRRGIIMDFQIPKDNSFQNEKGKGPSVHIPPAEPDAD